MDFSVLEKRINDVIQYKLPQDDVRKEINKAVDKLIEFEKMLDKGKVK